MIPHQFSISYHQRCLLLGLETLSKRRWKAQCVFIFRLLNGEIDSYSLPPELAVQLPPHFPLSSYLVTHSHTIIHLLPLGLSSIVAPGVNCSTSGNMLHRATHRSPALAAICNCTGAILIRWIVLSLTAALPYPSNYRNCIPDVASHPFPPPFPQYPFSCDFSPTILTLRQLASGCALDSLHLGLDDRWRFSSCAVPHILSRIVSRRCVDACECTAHSRVRSRAQNACQD